MNRSKLYEGLSADEVLTIQKCMTEIMRVCLPFSRNKNLVWAGYQWGTCKNLSINASVKFLMFIETDLANYFEVLEDRWTADVHKKIDAIIKEIKS